jgi:hypothetical protein
MAADISANIDVISSKSKYGSKMAKQSSDVSGVQPFFGLVNDVSALLVGARSAEIDVALDDCLARLGEYFDAHQVALGQISKSGELLPFDPPGPELVTHFVRNGFVIWNCLEDLDELPHWREHCRQVGAVAGAMWLHRDFGSHVEGMALSGPSSKVWPEDTVECLGAIGGVLFNAFYRRRAEAEMEQLQRLEQVIAEVAARLVRVHADDVDAEINNALGRIGGATGTDLCVFLRCNDPDASMFKVNYEWTVDAVNGPVFSGVDLAADYPWLVRQLQEKTPLHLSSPDDCALEAKAEFELLKRFDIQSMNWEPFEAAHGRCGYIGLGTLSRTPRRPDSFLPQLSLFGNIVADAIDRQRTDVSLGQAFNEIQALKERL